MTATPVAIPEIVFNLATGQNQFFVELADALVYELQTLGHRARLAHDEFPASSPDRVDVLTPPHEYVTLSRYQPAASILKRCIGISAEQPESHFFYPNCELGLELGAVFDINHRGVRAYTRTGIDAQHLQLGFSPVWDRSTVRSARDIDILFMGRSTWRRERALSRYAGLFQRYRCHLQLADGGRPSLSGATDFLAGDAKRDLMARSKVMLTLHGEDEPYFEWLRIVEAMCAGCLVVSEHSTDVAPLVPGEHLLTGDVDRLGLLTAYAVDRYEDLAAVRNAGLDLLRDEVPLSQAAAKLAEAAGEIAAQPWSEPTPDDHLRFILARRAAPVQFERQPSPSAHTVAEGQILRALKAQALTELGARRRLARIEAVVAGQSAEPTTEVVHTTTAWSEYPPPEVSVVVPLYNHGDVITDALDSVAGSHHTSWELVVVDDASSDGGGEVVQEWMRQHDDLAVRLVSHSLNRGLPHARNTGVAQARTELLLMLDADNELGRQTISKLQHALGSDPDASFAYGILERFGADGPMGLVSHFAWDPDRLRAGNYIDALALIRRGLLDHLGGYSTDARLHGWEDYDLWVRAAEAGHRAAFVPEIIARYRVGASSMLSLSNISSTDAFAAVVDHAPNLMRDLRIPY